MKTLFLFAASLLALPACTHDDPCLYGTPGNGLAEPLPGYRNPVTGACETFGGGGGGGGGTCDPYGSDKEAPQAQPDWAVCYAVCEGLAEDACLDTSGCRAIYQDTCPPNADCDESAIVFSECWGTAPSGPVQGECSGLDAQECSRHDDCSAVHWTDPTTQARGEFGWCMDEPAGRDPGTCDGELLCDIRPPGCPPGTVPGIADDGCYSGMCIPESECETPVPEPGLCYAEAVCTSLPPACPQGTLPGVKDGCWTGYCIPLASCEEAPACAGLGEAACVSRADCDAFYTGVDCTCDASGCVCASWTFDSCEASAP